MYKIKIPIYEADVKLFFSEEEYNKYLGKDEGNCLGAAGVKAEDNCYFIFIDNNHFTHNTLAHECYHLVDHIFADKGMDYNKNGTNEHWAYLIGYLVEVVLKYKDKYDKK